MRTREQAIDAELADVGGRLPATELAVDNLEWHAEKARAMADTVRQADDLQAQSRRRPLGAITPRRPSSASGPPACATTPTCWLPSAATLRSPSTTPPSGTWASI